MLPFLRARRHGEWAHLELHPPGQRSRRIGVILRDIDRNQLYLKVQPWPDAELYGLDRDTLDVCQDLSTDLEDQARELGAGGIFEYLSSTASHTIRIGTREKIATLDFDAAVRDLYRQCVEVEKSGGSRADKLGINGTKVKSSIRAASRILFDPAFGGGACAIVLICFLCGVPQMRMLPPEPTSEIQGFVPVLPFPWPVHTLSEIEFNSPTPDAHARKKRHRVLRNHPKFLLTREISKVRPPDGARLPPAPHYIVDVSATANVIPFRELPPPPAPRKRNRFVRTILAIAAPFRT